MAGRGGCFKRRSPAANQAALVGSQREAEPSERARTASCPALSLRRPPNNTGRLRAAPRGAQAPTAAGAPPIRRGGGGDPFPPLPPTPSPPPSPPVSAGAPRGPAQPGGALGAHRRAAASRFAPPPCPPAGRVARGAERPGCHGCTGVFVRRRGKEGGARGGRSPRPSCAPAGPGAGRGRPGRGPGRGGGRAARRGAEGGVGLC